MQKMSRVRSLVGALALIMGLSTATASVASAESAATHVAPASTQATSWQTTFYCGSADLWTVCSLNSSDLSPNVWFPGGSPSVHILVNNHASGGEYCRIIVNGGRFDVRYVAPTYKLWTWLGNTGPDPAVQLECLRGNPSGDAGIGGYIQFNY